MSVEEILAFAREEWGAGLEPCASNVHAAAVGLASSWYRNTNAVETFAHADGPWTDEDMLRHNAWATELARRAIIDVVACGADLAAVDEVLESLLDALVGLLPSDVAMTELQSEKESAPALAADWITTNGLGNWLAFLTRGVPTPAAWWGAPDYHERVERYCRLDPGPPAPETFRDRMMTAPWELSDEQAAFVCDHRYDVHSPSPWDDAPTS